MTYTEKFAGEYLGKIFYFCLKKTGDEHHAEELASDIGFEVLSSLSRGANPENFDAWVWTVARNRFGKWAKKKYYSKDAQSIDIEEMENLLSDNSDIENALVLTEDLSILRRELAFIRSDYRKILVAHYFEEKSVSMISREFGIPLGTVKTKLQNSRKILKEGMNMAREFGKRSYNPEHITFVNNCNAFGKNGQPWTILNHSLYKNIFLEAYGEPKTAEELSLELGIALPYMEDELNFLVKETFLTCKNGKYETAFPILSREAQSVMHEYNESITEEATKLLTELIDKYIDICEKQGVKYFGKYQSYEDAKWTLLMLAFDNVKFGAISYNVPRTKRPNEGEWDIVGYEDNDFMEPDFVGKHGSKYRFWQYKFNYKNIYKKTPDFLEDKEAEVLHKIVLGENVDGEREEVAKLLEAQYIRMENGVIIPNIAVFGGENAVLDEKTKSELLAIYAELREICCASVEEAKKVMLKDLPQSLHENAAAMDCMHGALTIERGYVLEQAIENGWLKYDENSGAIGAYMKM